MNVPNQLPNHFQDGTAWYTIRTKTKCEHIASAHLRQLENVETFCPRIRYHKATLRGKVLFHQAMFPCYVFARFDFENQSRAVTYANGVSTIVHFGAHRPPVAPEFIDFLRAEIGPDEVKTLKPVMEPGDEVEIAEGPFRGIQAIVHHYMPAKDRVRVLMEILGQVQPVDISTKDLVALNYE
ncbi:MAG: transcriptional antiterminator RfaH [Verrucomicrobiales bacterium]